MAISFKLEKLNTTIKHRSNIPITLKVGNDLISQVPQVLLKGKPYNLNFPESQLDLRMSKAWLSSNRVEIALRFWVRERKFKMLGKL